MLLWLQTRDMADQEQRLLPRTHGEFRTREYWDDFFETRDAKAFEWYGEWSELRGCVERYVEMEARLLVVGCGNSNLSQDMYEEGWQRVVNVDFSPVVIEEMAAKTAVSCPGMEWKLMDMTAMGGDGGFADGTFDAVLDKGALDALMAEDSREVAVAANKMLEEVVRVLKPDGVYVVVSMCQDFILQRLLSTFREAQGWAVDVHALERGPTLRDGMLTASPLQPFVLACRRVPGAPPAAVGISLVFDKNFGRNAAAAEAAAGRTRRAAAARAKASGSAAASVAALMADAADDPEVQAELVAAELGGGDRRGVDRAWATMRIGEMQELRATKAQLMNLTPQRIMHLELWGATDTQHGDDGGIRAAPRFKLAIVDAPVGGGRSGPCAVFIVPRGRERSFMFAHEDGQRQLSEIAGFCRLVIVSLCHVAGHVYGDTMQALQEELDPHMIEIVPPGALSGGATVPYLTDGGTDESGGGDGRDGNSGSAGATGLRVVVYEGVAEMSGSYVVEDVPDAASPAQPAAFALGAEIKVREVEGSSVLRRLFFLDNPHVVQSEVRMRWVKEPCEFGLLEDMKSGGKKSAGGKKRRKKKGGGGGGGGGGGSGGGSGGAAAKADGDTEVPELKCVIDPSYLAFQFHRAMVTGLALVWPSLVAAATVADARVAADATALSGGAEVLVVGLGGGGLPMYLCHSPLLKPLRLSVTAVELDEDVAAAAVRWFDCRAAMGEEGEESEGHAGLRVEVDDGLAFISRLARGLPEAEPPAAPASVPAASGTFDIIVLDVDSKDESVGMSCPPEAFVAPAYLANVRRVLRPTGLLMINVAARSDKLLEGALKQVRGAFEPAGAVWVVQPDANDVNRCIYAMKSKDSANKIAKNPTKLGIESFERLASHGTVCPGSASPKKVGGVLQAEVEQLTDILGRMCACGSETE